MPDLKYLHHGGIKMRILHLALNFFPEYSGTTTRLYSLLSSLPYEIVASAHLHLPASSQKSM